ncbi:MAG: SusC/RagA family TonB-linked outer membrane protein [Bacteroidales bacterium]|nr:SusC/RagA family TonB-linked outer membrane protein [Bacteroidales bacterium]
MKIISHIKKMKYSFLSSILTFILAIFVLTVQAQNSELLTISGTVTDRITNETMPGVNVTIKGTQQGTVTNNSGEYSLEVEKGLTLVFSFIGYENMEIKVENAQPIIVNLNASVESLNEVVVIGYGTTTKKEVTGSISTIKSDDFNQGTFTDPMGLIQGKVAGLSIIKPNGSDPQARYQIMLRGTNTLTSGQQPLIIVDGIAGVDLKDISFEEVESFDVLKDGAAAAIYGTRGSNGVIIVTTKRAKAGKVKIEFTSQLTAQVYPKGVENLTSDEFRYAINKYAPDKSGNIYDNNTDWFKEVTRSMPISQTYNIAFSGGTENFSSRTIAFIDIAEGLQKKNQSNNYVFKTNMTQKALDGLLTLDYNLNYSTRKYNPANYSIFYQAFIQNPTAPVYDEGNTYTGGYSALPGIDYYNPVAMLNEQTREGTTTDFGGNITAKLNITKSLNWVNLLSVQRSEWDELTYKTKYYPTLLGRGGEAEISHGKSSDVQYESTINYLTSIGKHNFQALGGYAFQELIGSNSYMINSGFDSDIYGPYNIGAGSALGEGTAEMGSYKGKSRLISFFSRVMYNYDERYLLAVSLRREGSSRFGENHKWGWFPSISAGWRINKEDFLSNAEWLNNLKLRVGYGVTGNQDIGNYRSLILLGKAGKFYYNGEWINTYQPISNPNPDLKWENKHEVNLGLDFSFLKNRVGGSVDVYYRSSTDLLYTYNVPVPPYLYNEYFTNIGTISNKGIEVTLNGVVLQKNDLQWTTILTYSKNINKLEKFSNEEFTNKSYDIGWLGGAFPLNSQRIEEGKPLGTFYGPVWLGVDENGNDIFKNANPVGKVDPEDWEPIGNAYPDYMIGWSNSITYKNWNVNFSIRSSIGGKVLNTYRLYYENWKSIGTRNIMQTQLDNPEFTGNATYSSKYIEDASFVSLDNVSIGYNVPVRSKYISKLNAFVTAQNVYTITGYKGMYPEVSLSGLEPGIESLTYYPRTTGVTVGVNVAF